MLRIGLDFHETITSHPKHFKDLAKTIIAGGGEVYIITAVAPWNKKLVQQEIEAIGIMYTGLEIVVFNPETEYDNVPKLKLQVAKFYKLDFMLDDRPDTCQKMTNRGITGLIVSQRRMSGENKPSGEPSIQRVESARPASRGHGRISGHVGTGAEE